MAVETELKLRIAPEQLAKLKRHALLKVNQLTRPVTRRLYNIYYDTPKLELHKSGMALRLRRSGRQWLQTLKGDGSVQGGLHQRNEWEMPVSGPVLDFTQPQAAKWDAHLPYKMRKKLQPLFITDFSRNSRMLTWQGAQIELCMDQGEISTENQRVPLCELELELKSGEPQQLFGLALAILDIVPFELESISKAEQGFHLMAGNIKQPIKAMFVALDKHEELGHAMQKLFWSVLQHWQGNVSGVKGSSNAEYLHQMRVALRRMRVLLRMAESVCADEQLAVFRKEVVALGITLGKIREWDVFIEQVVQPLCVRMPEDADLQVLLSVSKQQRDDCYKLMHNDERARAMQRLLLRFSIWMHGSYWQKHEWIDLKCRDFASAYLTELVGKFEQAGEQMEGFDAEKLHKMRIRAKKLRYGTEFFASLFGKHKSAQYLGALSRVQEVLGQINDDAVARRLLDDLATTKELTDNQKTLSLVRGWLAHDQSDQHVILDDVMRNFNKQKKSGKNVS
jgi:inorganic triphosphatase YgiF